MLRFVGYFSEVLHPYLIGKTVCHSMWGGGHIIIIHLPGTGGELV